MCNPARQPSDGKEYREHLHGNPDGPINHARVEIHVGIQLSFDEVRVLECHCLEFLSHFKKWILNVEFGEKLVAGRLDDSGSGIEVLVDAMSETHQTERARFVLGQVDVLIHITAIRNDLLEHRHHRLIRPAMQRPPKGTDAGGDRSK